MKKTILSLLLFTSIAISTSASARTPLDLGGGFIDDFPFYKKAAVAIVRDRLGTGFTPELHAKLLRIIGSYTIDSRGLLSSEEKSLGVAIDASISGISTFRFAQLDTWINDYLRGNRVINYGAGAAAGSVALPMGQLGGSYNNVPALKHDAQTALKRILKDRGIQGSAIIQYQHRLNTWIYKNLDLKWMFDPTPETDLERRYTEEDKSLGHAVGSFANDNGAAYLNWLSVHGVI